MKKLNDNILGSGQQILQTSLKTSNQAALGVYFEVYRQARTILYTRRLPKLEIVACYLIYATYFKLKNMSDRNFLLTSHN